MSNLISGSSDNAPKPPSLQPLDPTIFNQSLFTSILRFWFAELPYGATAASPKLLFKWFGRVDADSKAAFDASCRGLSAGALASIGPDRLQLPPFQGYAEERALAPHISSPFRDAIHRCSNLGDGGSGSGGGSLRPADATLAMMLLLDQMPRNIFRKVDELGVVYAHYDRLARALLYCVLHPQRADDGFDVFGLDRGEEFGHSPVHGCFFYVVLQHSEALEDHDEFDRRALQQLENIRDGDVLAEKFIKSGIQFEREHRGLLERFGRYPYRNKALGRGLTTDEEKYLKEDGETFGTNSGV
ncbi:unnamed protein product [Periconia digitata]|uniref:DUF924-domain-containing protein n=1 Tax=Periconia digitata TaxID=1303443 RepID=A0A9W4XP96_9PLEO|nr:unnamed protein product [Periconia digitata]